MRAGTEEARLYALGLLRAGLSPEEAEAALAHAFEPVEPLTALSDPANYIVFKEVTSDGSADAPRPR